MKKWKYVNAKRVNADTVEYNVITIEGKSVEQEKFTIEKKDAFSKFVWQVTTDARASESFKIDKDFPYVRELLEQGYIVNVIIDYNGKAWYQQDRGDFRNDILRTVEFEPLQKTY